MIYICIVEDQKSDFENLKDLLDHWFIDSDKEYSIDSYISAEEFLSNGKITYDLYFLDIELDKMSGYDLAKEIRKKDNQSLIIFTTNLASYIQKAYGVNALTYLLKPIQKESFDLAMQSVMKALKLRQKKKILIKTKEGLVALNLDDILYVESLGHNIIYHTLTGSFEEWSSLSKVEEEIKKYGFSRIKTSLLVNMKYITKVHFDSVELCSVRLHIGRTYRKSFLKDMNQWMNR